MQGMGLGLPVDESRPGGVLTATDELQKIVHGLEEQTIGLRSRLLPVLRDDNTTRYDQNPNTPEPPRSPLENQLRNIGHQLQIISANIDDILKRLEMDAPTPPPPTGSVG